jgi:hypothetical protein
MTEEDVTTPVDIPKKEEGSACIKEDILSNLIKSNESLTVLMTGNSHPEKGFVVRMFKMADSVEAIKDHLEKLDKKADENKNAAAKASHALDLYKAEMSGIDVGAGKKTAKVKLKFDTIVSLVGTLVIVLTLIVSFWWNRKDTKNTDDKILITSEKVDNLGSPVVVNKRGELTTLPKGDTLKYFKDGELVSKDSIKNPIK